LAVHSGISEPTIARLESADGELGGRGEPLRKIRAALEASGIEFVEENGTGEGVAKVAGLMEGYHAISA